MYGKKSILVKRLGKKYKLGQRLPYLTITDAIRNTLSTILHSPANSDLSGNEPGIILQKAPGNEDFWAFREISFSIDSGDVVGIIGRNGAGKSTLLKILSRITSPSEGEITINGRVGSLLEVGTGFHPELTGRENIYLSGLILGMRKHDIEEKFEEIIKFSGVEKYLDTPVKRYSSGMNVRLGFSVAAHLDPEILLVDEVLAVGDADFQKKCLGKMGEISKGGRTVLFVSHSMPMISSLCNQCILLNNGRIQSKGETKDVIASYLLKDSSNPAFIDYTMSSRLPGDYLATLLSGWIENSHGDKTFEININEPLRICMRYRVLGDVPKIPSPNFHVYDYQGQCVFVTSPIIDYNKPCKAGEYFAVCEIPGNFLNDGLFSVHLALTFHHTGEHVSFWEKHALTFNITDPIDNIISRPTGYSGRIPGVIRTLLQWNIECVT